MADNYAETFFQTSPFWQMAGEQYVPGSMDDPFSDTGIQQPLHYEIPQIGPTGHNTEQDSGLSQTNMVGTDVTAAVTGRPGQKRNDPFSETAIDQSLHYEIPQIGPTRYNTEQGFVSGSGLPLHIQGPTMGDMRFVVQGSGLHQANNMVGAHVTAAVTGRPVPGHDNGIQGFEGRNMLQIESTGHNTEQGFGSGVPQANMVETEATAAVPGRPGQKRNGEINSAERSKNSRAKKKKDAAEMKEKMERAHEKNKRIKKDNKKLKRNLNESNQKLDDQLEKIHQLNEKLASSKEACDKLQIQIDSLSQTLLNMSSLPEENRKLQADKDRLMQLVNAGTNEKKWVEIPLGDKILKIEGNVLFLEMA